MMNPLRPEYRWWEAVSEVCFSRESGNPARVNVLRNIGLFSHRKRWGTKYHSYETASWRLPCIGLLLLVTLILFDAGNCLAELGFTAYGGGTVPAGEFSKTDISRQPPKSGAEAGHSYGAGISWRFRWQGADSYGRNQPLGRRFSPEFVLTLEYSESEFGNNAPVNNLNDTLLFLTPESRIRIRGVRAALRVIPWPEQEISPTFGLGFQRQKLRADLRTFFAPGQHATQYYDAVAARLTSESGQIFGWFGQFGIAYQSERSVYFFVDALYHFLFSEGVKRVDQVNGQRDPEDRTINSDQQWWEFRTGVIFFFSR